MNREQQEQRTVDTHVAPREDELLVRRKLEERTEPATQGWVHRLLFKALDRVIDSIIRRFEASERRCAALEKRCAALETKAAEYLR